MRNKYWLVPLAVYASFPAFAHEPAVSPRAVTVSGEGIIRKAPDKADVTLNVQAQDRELTRAKAEADRKLTAAMGILRDMGIDKEWVRTDMYNIQPQYSYNNGRQYLEGYQVTNILFIELQEPSKVGFLLEKMVGVGVDQIQGVQYGLKETDALKKQALEKAMAQAKDKAEALAASAGASIGGVLSIQESGAYIQPPVPMMAFSSSMEKGASHDSAVAPPAGETEVRANVQAMFALER